MLFKEIGLFVDMPNSYVLPNFNSKYRIKLPKIEKTIRNLTASEILVIGFFGSAIKEPTYTMKNITKRFLWFSYQDREEIRDFPVANDVDCLVITKDTSPQKITTNLKIEKKTSDGGYGFYWVDNELSGALHLLISSLANLSKAIKKKDKDAIRIVKDCKFLMGYHDVLNDLIKQITVCNSNRRLNVH